MIHGERIRIHGDGVKKALGTLVKAAEQVLAKSAFFRRLLQQHIVIVSDAELFRQHRADLATAAAILPSNGNDHRNSSF